MEKVFKLLMVFALILSFAGCDGDKVVEKTQK